MVIKRNNITHGWSDPVKWEYGIEYCMNAIDSADNTSLSSMK